MHRTITLILSGIPAVPAAALQDVPDAAPAVRRGRFETTFSERHELSDIKTVSKRFGLRASTIAEHDQERRGAYDIEQESFQVLVPDGYDPERPAGLLVWISPSDDGRVNPDWSAVLERMNLIAVGADDAGNERFVWYRCGLALDAVHNVRARYSIDAERVYVAGFSGGGRAATRLGLHFSDVFRGGIYMGGCSFYRELPNPDAPGSVFPQRFPKPSGARFVAARTKSRHAIVVGERDPNRTQSRLIATELETKERFAHVSYLEIPELGHTWAPREWFEKALQALDAPLLEAAERARERARKRAGGGDDDAHDDGRGD